MVEGLIYHTRSKMDNAQMRIIKEIMENKDLYLSMTDDKKYTLIGYYTELTPLLTEHYNNLFNLCFSRIQYDKALKEHKVDPYLAGGAAQGIAGVGAGIVTAINAENRNQKIDLMRATYKEKVFNDSVNTSISERRILNIVKKIDNLLDSVESIKEYRDQKIEEEYQLAMKYMMMKTSSSTKVAYDKFLSLGEYKDSVLMAEKSKSANNARLIKEVIIISLICSAFLVLLALIFCPKIELIFYVAIFFWVFLVLCVYFGITAWKNRIK